MQSLFPALAFGSYCQLPTARMHYIDAGTGKPMLFVHGNPTWSFYWRRAIETFRTSRRVVAVDHVGCGLSDKPQQYRYCLDQHIDNLRRLVESLDLREITLVVHDWGGPIGVGAALAFPDRIERMVLTNTGCFPPPYIPWRIRLCRIPFLGTMLMRGVNAFARAATTMATTQRGGLPEEARRGLLAPYDSWENRVAIDRFVFDIPSSRRQATWQRLEAIESGITALNHKPSLLIWGMRDWCFRPDCLARLQQLLPRAQTIELAETGHYVMEDSPQRAIEAMAAFVDDHREPANQVGS